MLFRARAGGGICKLRRGGMGPFSEGEWRVRFGRTDARCLPACCDVLPPELLAKTVLRCSILMRGFLDVNKLPEIPRRFEFNVSDFYSIIYLATEV